MRAPAIVAVLLGAVACQRAPVVAAAPSGQTPEVGDTNGDGAIDLSDGLFVLRHLMAGGSRSVCQGAADTLPDRRVDLGDAFAIWYHLYAGNTALGPMDPAWCSAWDTLPAPAEGRMALTLDAPRKAVAEAGVAGFEATVQLQSEDLAVEGWSLAAAAEGCQITSATVAGTEGADLRDSPAGARDGGFERTDLGPDGAATSAVVLGWLTPVALSPSDEPVDLLILKVQANVDEGCVRCTVRLEDGGVGGGLPVDNVISVGGRSYRPELPEVEVKLCAG